METITCPLCNSSRTKIIESIDTLTLQRLYKRRAGVDVRRFFKTERIDEMECADCRLKFYWPQVTGDGEFYDSMQKLDGYYLHEKDEFIRASASIKPTDDVLEIGCGEGIFGSMIKCNSFTGLEFSEDAIKKATRKGLKVLKQSIQEHAQHHHERYDVVCYFQVLEHIKDPGGFIRQSVLCLRRGGKLLIAVPSEDSFIAEVSNFYLNMPPHHASKWRDETLRKIAEFNDLSVEYIYHEPLNKAHTKFYLSVIAYNRLNKFFNRKQKAVESSPFVGLMHGASVIFSFVASPLLTNRKKIKGQSVLIQLVKN
jgi:2-polyprenyl-3-methyl-5-hydroxy-6-metoxy-1,4-benzoquinol methylase